MDNHDLVEATIKGFIGAGIAVIATILVHRFLTPVSGLSWALLAVTLGAWFSGFFSAITGDIVCRDGSDDKKDEYLALGSVLIVLGVTVYENTVSSLLMILGGVLFLIGAYQESDESITEKLPDGI